MMMWMVGGVAVKTFTTVNMSVNIYVKLKRFLGDYFMKSVDFPETVSAKVTSRCKKLLEKHNISVRSAVEVGLNTLLSSKRRLEFEIMELDKEIREVKLDLIALEMERDQLLGKLEGLHSSEEPVEIHKCKQMYKCKQM